MADPISNVIQIDGNLIDEGGGGTDWCAMVAGGAANIVIFSGVIDDTYNNPQDEIFTGGSQDLEDVPMWSWTRSMPQDKNDIENAMAAIMRDPVSGDVIFAFAADRYANNGDAQIGFWFFQQDVKPLGANGGDFTGVHVDGDLLMLAHFTNGGAVANLQIYRWQSGAPVLLGTAPITGVDARTNTTLIPASGTCFPYTPKAGAAQTYPPVSFFEGAIDLTQFGLSVQCFNSFVFETRSSQSLSAELKDFVQREFATCCIDCTKTVDHDQVCAGAEVNYTVAVSNCGAQTLTDVMVIDDNGTPANTADDITLATGLTLTTGQSATFNATTNPPLHQTITQTTTNSVAASGHANNQLLSHTCQATVTVNGASSAAAGPDRSLCQAASGPTCFTPLAGSATNGTPSWSVVSEPSAGCVSIQNGNTTTPTVCFAAGCTGAATLRLTVTSSSTPPCPDATDDVVLTVVARPTADAGADQTTCQAASGATCFSPLPGSAANGAISWSVVSEPSASCVSIQDGGTSTPTVCFAAGCTGAATLRLTVTGTAPCTTATDDVVLTVVAHPNADAGPDRMICQAATGSTCFTPLAGSSSNGTSSWSVISEPSAGCVSIQNGNTATPTVCFAAGCTGQAILQLTVTDGTACQPATDQLTLTVVARPLAAAGLDQTICQAASGATCFAPLAGSASNGTPSWSVVSEPSAGCVGIQNGNSAAPTVCFASGCTGIATLRLTVTDGAACNPAADDVTLTVVAHPIADAGPNLTICQAASGSTCFAPLAGSATAGTPSWSVISQPQAGCVTLQNGNTATPTVCFAAGCIGSATLRLTVTGSAPCQPDIDDVTLTVIAHTIADAGPDRSICQAVSGPTCFTPLAGNADNGTPSWSVISEPSPGCVSIQNGNTENPTLCFANGCTGAATLRLTVTDAETCNPATDDVVLTVIAHPSADAGPNVTICQTASGPTCFSPLAGIATDGAPSWSVVSQPQANCVTIQDGNTASPTVCFAAGCTGSATLRLTVTGASPCATDTDDVVLTVLAHPIADAGPDRAACQAASGSTCFTLAGAAIGGTPSWSVVNQPSPGCITIQNGNTATPTVCFAAGCTGAATLRLTVAGGSTCVDVTDDVVLTVVPHPTANAGSNQSICQAASGPSCFAPLAGSAGNGTPSWSVVNQPSAGCVTIQNGNTATPTVCFAAGCTGSATLRLTVTGVSPCTTATDQVVLTVEARPDADAGPDRSICQAAGGQTCFTPLAGNADNGTPSWSIVSQPSPMCVSIQNGNTATPTVCFAAGCTGAAVLRLTVTGDSPCAPVTDDIELTVVPRPSANAGPDRMMCQAAIGPTCFTLAGSATNGNPTWSVVSEPTPGCVSIQNGNSATPTICFAAGCTGTATLRLTVSNGAVCNPATDTVVVAVMVGPTADAGSDRGMCQAASGPNCMTLDGMAANGTPSWSMVSQPAAGCVSIQGANTATPTVCFANGCTGSCTLRLTVTGSSACAPATDEVTLTVNSTPSACTLDAPQAGLVMGSFNGGVPPFTCTGSVSSAPNNDWMITGCQVTDDRHVAIMYAPGSDVSNVVLSATVTDANGCSTACSTVILVIAGCSVDRAFLPICSGGTGTFCAEPIGGVPPFVYNWTGPGLPVPMNDPCITVQGDMAGTYTYTVTIKDGNGFLSPPCVVTLSVFDCVEFCSFTQGAYGNAGGHFNGIGRLQLIQMLLTPNPLVLGKRGRSMTVPFESAACIIARLPAGGTAGAFPDNLGDAVLSSRTCQTTPPLELNSNGRFRNVFLGQVITLSLNVRLNFGRPHPGLGEAVLCHMMVTQDVLPGPDGIYGTSDDELDPGPDGMLGTADDPIHTITIPLPVLDALTHLDLPLRVSGLLELANRGLAGQNTDVASITDLNDACSAINEGFDGCRFLVGCMNP